MAFSKKTWLDRIAEYPTRRRLKKSDGTDEIVSVSREEGAISQEGDAFSAANMNDLEDRVASEFDALNLKMDEVKYSTVQSANSEYISNVGGYICKQGNVCYMAVSFTTLKTRDIGSLFKFSDYLAPKGASVIGHIYNNNTEAVCGFLFPTKAHANYNNGFIRNQASLSPGAYMLRVTWIDA